MKTRTDAPSPQTLAALMLALSQTQEELARVKDDLAAELMALRMGVIANLNMASIAMPEDQRPAVMAFIHDGGLRTLREANYWSVPAGRRDAVVAKAEARWSEITTSKLDFGGEGR